MRCWFGIHRWMYWADGWPGSGYVIMRGCQRCRVVECLGENEYQEFHAAGIQQHG